MENWVKLATRYYADPKVTGLPDADTELMFVRGLGRAGEVARGGFIPESDLPLLTRRRRWASCVEALVAAGLWSPVDGGYRITAWADWQSAADALAARRQADRERQRKHRQHTSRDNAEPSRDVTAVEGEVETLVTQGGTSTHDPTDRPPPRKCQQHANDLNPPPCGPCADARRAHDAWQHVHQPPAVPGAPVLPPVEQVIDRYSEIAPDHGLNVDAIHRIRQQHPLATSRNGDS